MIRGIAAIALGLAVTALVPLPRPVSAASIDDDKACGLETARQEQRAGIPDRLLHAISLIESGRRSGDRRVAWPWTVQAEGEGRLLDSKAAAVALVRELQAKGVRNIDVGCMQVNLLAHPQAFADLEQAFDPATNVAYAADLLLRLHERTGVWLTAAAHYHSRTPMLAAIYEAKVAAQWGASRLGTDDRLQPAEPTPATAAAALWFARGRAALLAQDYDAAELRLIRAVALDRGNALYLNALGFAAGARGRPERALAAYRMAIELDGQDGFAWYNTAVIHWNAGRSAPAIEAFRRAGLAYASKGDIARATQVLAELKPLAEGEKL